MNIKILNLYKLVEPLPWAQKVRGLNLDPEACRNLSGIEVPELSRTVAKLENLTLFSLKISSYLNASHWEKI